MSPESGFRIAPNWPQIGKMTMASQFADMRLSSNFCWRFSVSLVKFSYWSKIHVNIITGSGVMTIFFYKRLTRNLEIRNTTICVSPNIWILGQLRDTKFGTNVLMNCYWILQNARVAAFVASGFLREKPTGA